MIRSTAVAALVLAIGLGACSTTRATGGSTGVALGEMRPDGSILFKAKNRGLFGTKRGESVVFRPGEPGYDTVKAQLEALDSGIYKPVLTWSIGEVELTLPPGR